MVDHLQQARFAVIDLGTNTFHLLVVGAQENGSWEEYYRERIFVNLASGGIDWIEEEAMARGLNALSKFADVLERYAVDQIKAVGTAALRKAGNATAFIDEVSRSTDFKIEVITGLEEASYITQGTLSVMPKLSHPLLIMDVGGGSVEFIIVDEHRILDAQSYPIGVAVLYQAFHQHEPITASQVQEINAHLDQVLCGLNERIHGRSDIRLVGSSGTFEVLQTMSEVLIEGAHYAQIGKGGFRRIYDRIRAMNLEQRLACAEIPSSRAQYIVVALELIKYVLDQLPSEEFYVTDYAMKEGIIEKHFNF